MFGGQVLLGAAEVSAAELLSGVEVVLAGGMLLSGAAKVAVAGGTLLLMAGLFSWSAV